MQFHYPRLLATSVILAATALAATPPAATTPAATPPAATTPAANEPAESKTWDRAAAARYLDAREVWWQAWPHAQKDHETVCVSCHTQVPYALARPLLRQALGEQKPSDPEQVMLASIFKRVNLGHQAGTFYTDAENGPGKTQQARNTEYINNALILTAYDSQSGHLEATTRKALAAMWATQENSGPSAGAWIWQDFHFSPWEAPESEYAGAAMAAIATGIAPQNYQRDSKIQINLKMLRQYLRREAASQPLINRITLLWASSKLPGLMTDPERAALAKEIVAKQHADGGWSLTDLGQGTWKRHDDTAFDLRSDGYATGLIVLALEENGLRKDAATERGLAWILRNQDKAEGLWPAWSVNVKRDPRSDIGKFMSDAATGYSVLALEKSH